MIRKLICVLFAFALVQCSVLNPLGLTVDREKGDVVTGRITDAAVQVDLISFTAFTGSPAVSILSLLSGTISGIETDKYYVKADVDKCVEEIGGILGILTTGGTAAILSSCSSLEPDGAILGDPLPNL